MNKLAAIAELDDKIELSKMDIEYAEEQRGRRSAITDLRLNIEALEDERDALIREVEAEDEAEEPKRCTCNVSDGIVCEWCRSQGYDRDAEMSDQRAFERAHAWGRP